jgi:hypothetical protein
VVGRADTFLSQIFHERFSTVKVSDRGEEHHARVGTVRENLLLPRLSRVDSSFPSLRQNRIRVIAHTSHIDKKPAGHALAPARIEIESQSDRRWTCTPRQP